MTFEVIFGEVLWRGSPGLCMYEHSWLCVHIFTVVCTLRWYLYVIWMLWLEDIRLLLNKLSECRCVASYACIYLWLGESLCYEVYICMWMYYCRCCGYIGMRVYALYVYGCSHYFKNMDLWMLGGLLNMRVARFMCQYGYKLTYKIYKSIGLFVKMGLWLWMCRLWYISTCMVKCICYCHIYEPIYVSNLVCNRMYVA